MSLLLQLKQQNEQLHAEKIQTEQDMATVALEVKKVWESFGIKADTFSEGRSPSMVEMMKITSMIGRKFTSKTGKEELAKSWNKIQPILAKYQHVIKDTND
ncbi:MAG TPA: hypothetical protein PLP27_12535 [Crocinitomicaceae bacterium]|nr:hypothetical protein [Crocinitomicaceae bacterium]